MLTGSITNDIKHQFSYGNMVMKLIFVNIGVFLFFGIFNLAGFLFQNNSLYNLVLSKVEMPASLSVLLHQPWSGFTYMFLHTGFFHVLFNMLWFYWFGEIFVLYLGDKKILPLYIIGGLAGAITYLLAYNLLPVFKPQADVSMMLGASASVFAIVFAAATLAPDYEIRLMFLGSIKIKHIAIISLLLDIINIPYGNAGGYIAHIGGALSGYLYIKSLQSGFDFATPLNKFFDGMANLFKPKSSIKVTYKSETQKIEKVSRNKNEQQRVDDILDKIARSGYDSLTKEEKDFLFNYSKK
ncbi:MAG: rhomboid family intramembrane serine protease [Bacteroidetes bacterium]|nr:rhomboid family intramembrane serine protease [Bacteroidota bacterium]